MGRAVATLAVAAAALGLIADATPKPKPPKPRQLTVRLSGPSVAVYGKRVVLRGRVVPAAPGGRVRISLGGRVFAHARAGKLGGFEVAFALRSSGPYRAGYYGAVSRQVHVRLRPRLDASLVGSRLAGAPLALYAQLRPARSGVVHVQVFRDGRPTFGAAYRRALRLKVGTSSFASVRIQLTVQPATGYAAVPPQVLRAKLVPPELRYGATGPAVTTLLQRLRALHYAVPGTDTFGSDVLDSVYAFQKAQWLTRDGVVGPKFWAALAKAATPRARYPSGDHLEVDKSRQVLFVVRGGQVALIVPVSTAGIAGYSTPEGVFSIYRKVDGFDPSPLGTLYAPMYFTGGYAIHGNPSVPPYPASHGCIRTPMWIADYMFAANDYGETVYVYS